MRFDGFRTDTGQPTGTGRPRADRGQGTAEYALLLLAAATIALLVVSWASDSGRIGQLFDTIVDSIIGRI